MINYLFFECFYLCFARLLQGIRHELSTRPRAHLERTGRLGRSILLKNHFVKELAVLGGKRFVEASAAPRSQAKMTQHVFVSKFSRLNAEHEWSLAISIKIKA